jgi:hypothetical protein
LRRGREDWGRGWDRSTGVLPVSPEPPPGILPFSLKIHVLAATQASQVAGVVE